MAIGFVLQKTIVTATNWWLRSPLSSSSTNFANVNNNGNSNSNNATNSNGVAFGSCTLI